MPPLRIVGVRHHSPACAWLVEELLRELRPATVLVEGPSDLNERLDELALAHRPPIAIFSHWRHGAERGASWTPFCDYSPEWVALRRGLRRGAAVRFIDLPAWSAPVRSRSERGRAGARYAAALATKLGVDGYDALWDHLFEQPGVPDLEARLARYFEALRAAEPEITRADRLREAHMARHLAHAMRTSDGPVLVVCGGLHAPALAEAWRDAPADPPEPPRPPEGAQVGSYLVPYSFARLDALAGYRAGVPSPGFYQSVWELGPVAAGESVLREAAAALRRAGRPASTADLIAAEAAARALMRLRGHAALGRVDVLDGIAPALITEGLDAPLPWTAPRGARTSGDPRVAAVLDALRGTRAGALDPATPRPPLVADVAAALAAHDLSPAAEPREVDLDLRRPREREASRLLHRLRVLDVGGFTRLRGPDRLDHAELTERWSIVRTRDAEARLAEAAGWGATLEAASAARLEAMVADAGGDVARLSRVLTEALFVGLDALAGDVIEAARRQVLAEPRLGRLGEALGLFLAVYRHDGLFGAAGSPALGSLIRTMIARALWLFEGARGEDAEVEPAELEAVVAIRDALRHARAPLELDPAPIVDVMRRRAEDPGAPVPLRGAALGLLWSIDAMGDPEARAAAARALRGASRPERTGELLSGLLALARDRFAASPDLLGVLDAILSEWDERALLLALPSLRLAFASFPPRERDAIARAVLALHGGSTDVGALRELPADAEVVARGLALEDAVDRVAARYGLEPDR